MRPWQLKVPADNVRGLVESSPSHVEGRALKCLSFDCCISQHYFSGRPTWRFGTLVFSSVSVFFFDLLVVFLDDVLPPCLYRYVSKNIMYCVDVGSIKSHGNLHD